ncbi:ROK family protein [Neorhizobium galegae]|uniref:ROK family protein n=1 Tax=Neorhizobium galegae TaxID=399 RepID=UPI0006228A8F|nr:ROK family protein [Neorhizobium galegae]MCQ1765461.1 ROK family protein [Neorhizobium galegae]MCQ1844375.1 ROK family protein [Neorhizobium galegae]CDZ33165.1 N-acetyl-D-glucosamine kinase [Neorhizobium galegae bv. officinalis]
MSIAATPRTTGQVGPARPVFCVDIGGSFMKFAVSPAPGALVPLEKVATPAASWDDLAASLSALIERNAGSGDPASPLALSIAGLIDPRNGIATSANIPCITGRRIGDELSAILGRPVVAANDADCLTLAEANEGVGRGHSVVFCAIMGTGIGGGLAIDGRLVRGAGGVTGEWGHGPILNTSVELDGETVHVPRFACGCGQSGCVDTIGGARGIERLHHFLHGCEETSYRILADWQVGEARAAKTVAVYLELIADPLALSVNVTGASIVPVGGGLASVTPLIDALDQAVRKRILNRFDHPLVTPALRQEDGGLVGAAVLGHQSAVYGHEGAVHGRESAV